ncbi:MAG: uroporphyrinogen decarboxylase family protein [Promethearchaeota archaeon]
MKKNAAILTRMRYFQNIKRLKNNRMQNNQEKGNTFKKLGSKRSPTLTFLLNERKHVLSTTFNIIIKLLASDNFLGILYKFRKSILKRLSFFLLDLFFIPLEKKLGLTVNARACLFGVKGMKRKRTVIAHLFSPILENYILAWRDRQEKKIRVKPVKVVDNNIPDVWIGWKNSRDKVFPDFKTSFKGKRDKIIKILPDDTMNPKERINRLVDFKDVDRVGFGPTLSGHDVSFIGAQPQFGIGGLWQSCCGPGEFMAKATINSWIRLAGVDFFPTPMFPLAVPFPEVHSPFYFTWRPPPSNTIYEQFIEKTLFDKYQQIHDWGLSSLALPVVKSVMNRALVGLRETMKAVLICQRYFGNEFLNKFEIYAGSIFALWDLIPMARGFIPFIKDMKKHPELITEIFEFLEPGLTEIGLAIARLANAKYVLVGNSRGSNSWISKKMFEEIFWPTQKRTCEKIIKAGFKICAHLDNDWTENMELMLELPKHSGFFHLDQADLPRVRDIIGDHFCLMGNLSPALTTSGSPDQVYKETVKLIKACGQDGGYIVATGCEPPANVPISNYHAMKKAILDHGYYRR